MSHGLSKAEGEGDRRREDRAGQYPSHGPPQAAPQAPCHASCQAQPFTSRRRRQATDEVMGRCTPLLRAERDTVWNSKLAKAAGELGRGVVGSS